MAARIRKQIYIEPAQEALLKRIAHETGMSEAQIIREAIERYASELNRFSRGEEAWAGIRDFITRRMEQAPVVGERAWRREDLYDR